jgi:hypothetical protein
MNRQDVRVVMELTVDELTLVAESIPKYVALMEVNNEVGQAANIERFKLRLKNCRDLLKKIEISMRGVEKELKG